MILKTCRYSLTNFGLAWNLCIFGQSSFWIFQISTKPPNPFKIRLDPITHDLWLPSELPQVTPKTPNDDQQKSQPCQKIRKMTNACHKKCPTHIPNITKRAQICMNNLFVSMLYPWIIHRYLWTIHGNFEKQSPREQTTLFLILFF